MKPIRIVVFAKAPMPGHAKTRLIPVLGAQGAAALARQMLMHTLQQMLGADIGKVELCATPAITDVAWHDIQFPLGITFSEQGSGDLGERMARVVRRCIEQGESILLVGTDCPGLDAAQLRRISQTMSEKDAVLVPAVDGGYVAIGLNFFHPLIFSGIAWSTDSVAFDTLCRLDQLGCSMQQLPVLRDIDEPDDLRWLPESWFKIYCA